MWRINKIHEYSLTLSCSTLVIISQITYWIHKIIATTSNFQIKLWQVINIAIILVGFNASEHHFMTSCRKNCLQYCPFVRGIHTISGFPHKTIVILGSDIFFVVGLSKLVSKQSATNVGDLRSMTFVRRCDITNSMRQSKFPGKKLDCFLV